MFEISIIKPLPLVMGEGKGGGGRNRFNPPPLHPVPPEGGEILSSSRKFNYVESKRKEKANEKE
jgi:hypothetical protein